MRVKKQEQRVKPEFKVSNDFLKDLNPSLVKDMDANLIINHLEAKLKEREAAISDKLKLKQ